MPGRLTLDSIQFNLGPQSHAPGARPQPDTPFKILVLGDFQGAESNPPGKPVPVDLDNFDQVLSRLKVQISLSLDGPEAAPVTTTVLPLRSPIAISKLPVPSVELATDY